MYFELNSLFLVRNQQIINRAMCVFLPFSCVQEIFVCHAFARCFWHCQMNEFATNHLIYYLLCTHIYRAQNLKALQSKQID